MAVKVSTAMKAAEECDRGKIEATAFARGFATTA